MALTATKFITTVEARLDLLPIEKGQLIFVRDSKRIFLDYDGIRSEYGNNKDEQIIILQKEEERVNLENPFNAFYFILESHVLWRYENEWIPITTEPKEEIIFTDFLPSQGELNVLYSTLDNLYRWDGSQFIKMGGLYWGVF